MNKQNEQNLVYELIRNDGSEQNCKKLINFKCIISKALPLMPKQHIVRLIFDRKHQSLIAYQNGVMVGGTSFITFKEYGFAQLAFLAVRASKRIQGYGKKIISKTKSVVQAKKLSYILTFGDIMAVGFFRKQGFSQTITMPTQKWSGLIKLYEDSILMECKIHPTVDYLRICNIISMQKKYVRDLIIQRSSNHIKYAFVKENYEKDRDEVPIFQQAQIIQEETDADEVKVQQSEISEQKNIVQNQKLSECVNESSYYQFEQPKQQIFVRSNCGLKFTFFKRDPRSLPGISCSSWTWEEFHKIYESKQLPFLVRAKKLLQCITKYPDCKYFMQPINAKNVPNYLQTVKEPMCFNLIKTKINTKKYENQVQICEDINKIFENCMQFNHPSSVYCRSAQRLKQLIKPDIQSFFQGMICTNQQN